MITSADPVRPKNLTNIAAVGDEDRMLVDGAAGLRSFPYSVLRNQLLGSLTGTLNFRGPISGASVPATSSGNGDYYIVTAPGTSQSKNWNYGDTAIYRGSSGVWDQVQSPFRTVSVVTFGADPFGVIDSTAAIQMAAELAPKNTGSIYSQRGLRLIFPSGFYKTTARIRIYAGTFCEGDSQECTFIFPEHTNDDVFYCESLDGSSAQVIYSYGFSKLSIMQKAGTPTAGAAIHVRPQTITGTGSSVASRVFIDHVYIYGTFTGLDLYAIQGGGIHHSTISYCRSHGVVIDGYATLLEISKSWAAGNGTGGVGHGWFLKGLTGCTGIATGGDSNSGYAFYFDAGAEGSANGNEFRVTAERNLTGGVYVKNQTGGEFKCRVVVSPGVVAQDAITVDGGTGVLLRGCIVPTQNSCTGFPVKLLNPPGGGALQVTIQSDVIGTFNGGVNKISNPGNSRYNWKDYNTLGREGIGITLAPSRQLEVNVDAVGVGTASKEVARLGQVSTNNGGSVKIVLTSDAGSSLGELEQNSGAAGSFTEGTFGDTILRSSVGFLRLSGSKGVLVKGITKAQRDAIASPPDNLVIYQTDNTPGFRFRENGAWVKHTTTADP
jgi:hypothetical protein